MAKKKQTSIATSDSIQKTVDAGGARVTMTLTPEMAARWRLALAKFPEGRGQQIKTFTAALEALDAEVNLAAATDDALLAEVRRRMK